jgi:hypothetical protein
MHVRDAHIVIRDRLTEAETRTLRALRSRKGKSIERKSKKIVDRTPAGIVTLRPAIAGYIALTEVN